MSFRSSRSAPAVAASTRIRSASVWSSSWSIRPVHPAISRAHEIVNAPVVVAASSNGWRARRRIWRTAALASFRPRWFFAASHVALLAYPSASCPSSASNRRSSPLAAAPSREVIAPRASSASPRAAPSRSAAAGEFRHVAAARVTRSASATLPKPPPGAASAHPEPSAVHIISHPLPGQEPATGSRFRGGWRAGRPPRMRLLRLAHAGLPASPKRLPVRPEIIKRLYHDHLFDSCRLRHRQDMGLGRDGHGPFEKTGLICLGILGPLGGTRRPLLRAQAARRAWSGAGSRR